LQSEPRDADGREQERHHGGGDGGALQILAKITQARAMAGSPRKSMLPSMIPRWRNDHEMIENWLSKIHQKAMAESTVGTTNGISTIDRMIDLNGMFLLSSSAR
jgi:hypothetical protein